MNWKKGLGLVHQTLDGNIQACRIPAGLFCVFIRSRHSIEDPRFL